MIGSGMLRPENKALKIIWQNVNARALDSARPSWSQPSWVLVSTRQATNMIKTIEQTQNPEEARTRHDSKYLKNNFKSNLQIFKLYQILKDPTVHDLFWFYIFILSLIKKSSGENLVSFQLIRFQGKCHIIESYQSVVIKYSSALRKWAK